MTTSGTYTFSVTRDDIIKQSMQFNGKIAEEELPTATETQDLTRLLNMLVKQWQGKTDFAPGLKTWTRRRGYLFLNYNSGQYTVGPTGTGWTNSPILITTTAGSALGASTITVPAGLAGIAAGYNVGVQLSTGALQWTTVVSYVTTTITLTATLTASVALGAQVYVYQITAQQPNHVETALLRDNTLNDVPLRIYRDVQSYDMLPQKANPANRSDPGAIYYEFQLTNSLLFTDVGAAADVTKYIVLTYLEAIQDFTNPLDTPEYPQEWFLALAWGLTAQSHSMFNTPWTQSMEQRFQESLRIAQNKNPEVSADYFQCGEEA